MRGGAGVALLAAGERGEAEQGQAPPGDPPEGGGSMAS